MVLIQNAINVIVTNNNHNLVNNYEINGFKAYKDEKLDFIAIHLSSEMITSYIHSKFSHSRINQLISLTNRKFIDFYNCEVSENDLPAIEFISSDLLEKTLYIRNTKINPEKYYLLLENRVWEKVIL